MEICCDRKKKKYFVFLRKQGTEEKTDLHMALGYGDTPISLCWKNERGAGSEGRQQQL